MEKALALEAAAIKKVMVEVVVLNFMVVTIFLLYYFGFVSTWFRI